MGEFHYMEDETIARGKKEMSYRQNELEREADRLFQNLLQVNCDKERKWSWDQCREIAPLTLEINQLKQEKEAVLLAHSYVHPEIVYGVADFKSDSYALSLEAKKANAKVIVFAEVVFMAETAKILCPDAEVLVPDINSGCSLADSITADEVKALKKQYPEAAVVCYINTTAAIKAECDVCVTSSNVYKVIQGLPQKQVLFVPDRLMGDNIRTDLKKLGIEKEIITSNGTCEVHDQFDPALIAKERDRFPGLKVVSHPECEESITSKSDFVGSTGAMMKYVEQTDAPYFMMLTECGLVSRLEAENKGKTFIASCKLCPYMKMNDLVKVRDVLVRPRSEQIIEVSAEVREMALKSLDRMFELAE